MANIYLHYVLDLWVRKWRKERAHGDMIVVRYADDVVFGFQYENDARAFHRELAKRLRRKLKEIRQTLLWHRHKPVPEHGRWLRSVLQGYFRYHAIPGNNRALQRMRMEVARAWMRALQRRSQRGRRLNWEWMKQVVAKWLPPVQILHPYPDARFGVRT